MGSLSFIEAAHEILKQAGKPLKADEITSIALQNKLLSTSGKTPTATMSAQLYVDMVRKGRDSRFVKEGKGKFGLTEWSSSHTVPSVPSRLHGFKEAAYKVLKAENRPLSVQTITDTAMKKGLLITTGKTPYATMGSQLYVEIKSKGDKSAFVQLGKSKFGLREWNLEVIENEIESAAAEEALPATERKRSIVGDPLNFEGLIYGPLNENGVIFLFSKIHDKLGINIEAIQAGFPDAKGRRKTAKGWVDIWIEFEFKSSNFKIHRHDPAECDLIVCWEHDWKDCPIEVIALKEVLARLS
ncbi:winged helix-turn-helix domain-containing protein [Chloroflexota bacterium]